MRRMCWLIALALTLAILLVAPVGAHDRAVRAPVVIDTDMGLDDVMAVALALTSPDLEIATVVVTEGISGSDQGPANAAKLLGALNRSDAALYARARGRPSPRSAPDCRQVAEDAVAAALEGSSEVEVLPFDSGAYAAPEGSTVVLVLGPLTNLAAALAARPEMVREIERVVVVADPADADDFNLGFDPAATAVVLDSGVRVVFVAPAPAVTRAEGWTEWSGTSLADALLHRLAAVAVHQQHVRHRLGRVGDELGVLFLTEPELFVPAGRDDVLAATDGEAAAEALRSRLRRGRQVKGRVVITDAPLPDSVLTDDVRRRRERIVAANGEDEFFAMLLLNELHEHLGAYSIIGVKMGLRAAELLNAPQHEMAVRVTTPPTPPVSCLVDGLMVATGSTPGRGLLDHRQGDPDAVEAEFSYNGRSLVLRLREEYRQRIRSAIAGLLARYDLSDDRYWDGVRKLGLEIWEGWHRSELFDVVPRPGAVEREEG